MLLSDKEVAKVNDLLVDKGISYEPLRLDLLDHICCSIEAKMEEGIPFAEALPHSVAEFGIQGLETTQEATLYFLTLKLRFMRNMASTTGIMGGILAFTGAIFKMLHLPRAGILLFTGVAVLTFFFLPLVMLVKIREYQTFSGKLSILTGILAAGILLMGTLFKLLHWPYAQVLFTLGTLITCLFFLPLFYIRSYQQAENKVFNASIVVAILASVTVLYGMTGRGNSHVVDQALELRLKKIQENNDHLMRKVKRDDKRVLNMISKIEKTEASYLEQAGYSADVKNIAFSDVKWNLGIDEINSVTNTTSPFGPQWLSNELDKDMNELTDDLRLKLRTELDGNLQERLLNLPLLEVILELESIKKTLLLAC